MPFSDQKGEGLENKIAELIGEELKLPVVYTWYPKALGFIRMTLAAKKCDLVIVLAYMDRDLCKKVGLDTTGVDLILAAHQFPLYNTVEEAGDAVVAYVANQTKWIGEMRLYKSSDSKEMAITNYLHRDVPLDSMVPDDPDAIKVVQQARSAFMKMAPQAAPAPAPATTH